MSRRVAFAALAMTLALGAAAGPRAADFSLSYLEDRYIQQIGVDDESLHAWRLFNNSGGAESYTCTIFGDQTLEWFTFLCTGEVCVFDSADVALGSADTESLSVHAFPLGVPGAAYLTLRVRSHAAAETLEVKLTVLSDVTTLLVEDDGAADSFNPYYRSIADAAGLLNGVWDTNLEPLQLGDLDGKQNVVWFTGNETSTISASEQTIITDYLANFGNLLISGQNIASDLATGFLEDVLHAQLDNSDVASTHVDGLGGDPIGNGLSFDIAGGDGAGNQSSPDALIPVGGAEASFEYSTNEVAGLHHVGTGALVYLGYGIEGIDSEANRQAVLDAVLAWFDASAGVEDTGVLGTVAKAGPNPFSAQRPIAVRWDSGVAASPWRVDWYDANGRHIGSQDGFTSDGAVRFEWDGLGGAPLSSGVYLYQITAGSQTTSGRALYLAR